MLKKAVENFNKAKFSSVGYSLLLNLITIRMNKKIFLIVFCLFTGNLVFAQYSRFEEARLLFEDQKYSAAQGLYQQIINSGGGNESIEYYHAKCSKELFLSDAILLYHAYIKNYPYSQFLDKVNEDFSLLYFRDKAYDKAILYFNKLPHLQSQNNLIFKFAYANFCIDSLAESSYYFSKLMHTESKYASTSRYYYAYIAYEKGLYKTALNNFQQLLDDDKFDAIVPYYITQIYFFQKNYKQLIVFAKPLIDKVIPSRIAEVNRVLAEAYYNTQDYKEAIVHFNAYIEQGEQLNPIVLFLLGQSYYNVEDYENAVLQLEKVAGSADSIMQNSAYYLGASYLKLEHNHYALQAFKKASTYDYNQAVKEDAYFNYAKLSYQLELPFDNTLKVLKTYLESYNHPLHKQKIETLMVKTLQGTSRYLEAFIALEDIHLPTFEQQKAMQQLAYFLGIRAYNSLDYKLAISYFSTASTYQINADFSFLTSFWLADCYYQLSNSEMAADLYTDLPPTNTKSLTYYETLQKYNLAYCYFQQSNYQLSNKYFRIYEKLSTDSMHLNDTYLRIADGFFMTKEYSLAEKYYEKAIAYNLFDTDYAIYNRSLSLGLVGKHTSKVILLKQLLDEYTTSTYFDNALADLAKHFKNASKYDIALGYYEELLEVSKDADLVADAYLSKGMIYFNSNKVEDAITQFLFVVNNYQQTKYFKEALSGLQSAYASLGQIEQYLAIIDGLPEVSITKAEQDSLIYNTAFMKFAEGDYAVANITFTTYLQKFKNGIFSNDATYYNAISTLKTGDTTSAIRLYKAVVESAVASYQEAALIFLARQYYKLGDFELSNPYYKMLEEIASNNSLKREAIIRLMYGNENTNSDLAFTYAQKVVGLEKTDDWLLSKATIIIARNEFENGNYAKSRKTFEKVEQLSKYDEGAEAKYYLAYLTYLDDSLHLAEQMIFQLAEQYSSDHFIAKAFLLLTDIYIVQDNNFQAKATLESIIENHDGEDLVNVARKKWEQIVENEIMVEEVVEEQSYIDILEDEIDYELEFDNDTLQIIDRDYEVVAPDTIKTTTDSLNIIHKNTVEDEIE